MGAQLNSTEQSPSETTPEDVEALLEAARYNDIDDVKNLASAGVSLHSRDSQGRTALHMASANGHLDVVEYLISNGVDVNASNVEKNTPLHYACLNGHIGVVKSLILSGAIVSALNSHERTPIDEVVSSGKMEVVDAINTAATQLEMSRVTSQTYSLDANLCLLRLYQFEPDRMSTQIVARILFKALMAMPSSDFSLCLFLIPERVQMEEQVKTLIVLSHYLETARFQQFWDELAKSRHILEVVPGFEQAIQAYAVHILCLTYQKVPRSVLAEAINTEGPSLDKFLEHQVANCGWAVEKGQAIVLPANEFNRPELKKSSADSIPLERITQIFPILG